MCGIVGFISDKSFSEKDISSTIKDMSLELSHRGPDNAGFWIDNKNNIALGHTRLSILDLSSSGEQPMLSPNKRFVMVFNGEIYNHLILRKKVIDDANNKKYKIFWNGTSDTETLLVCFEIWGIEKTIERLVGMFSICLYDRNDNQIYLVRDRLGEKPLYYGYVNKTFVFASELKAIKRFPKFDNKIDKNALKKYFQYMYVPAPYSIYKNIFKLEPGKILSISINKIRKNNLAKELVNNITPYWSLQDKVKEDNKLLIKEDKIFEQLEDCLDDAIKLQSIADVPLGAFLSGGIDSSLITALMQKNSSRPIKTFTIGFEDPSYDESPFAKKVANHLGTEHSEIHVSSSDAREVIPNLPNIYDEPFADSSQIPTFLVCKAAAREVKVALSGDAGDEIFGGYNRYFWAPRLWNKVSWIPFPIRFFLGYSLDSVSLNNWNRLEGLFNASGSRNYTNLGNKAGKLGNGLINSKNIDDLYLSLISEWDNPDDIVLGADEEVITPFLNPASSCSISKNDSLNMMFKDSLSYLPDDILCKVDRAAMANSLETRVPFLDHRVVEFAWKMPLNTKIRNNQGKWALRKILYKYVPQHIIDRPKTGFGIPLADWLRGPLRDWAEELINKDKLIEQNILNHAVIRKAWKLHLDGRSDYTARIWSVLIFQSWLESNQ